MELPKRKLGFSYKKVHLKKFCLPVNPAEVLSLVITFCSIDMNEDLFVVPENIHFIVISSHRRLIV